MKAEELRIGNAINLQGKPIKVSFSTLEKLLYPELSKFEKFRNQFTPIELTEEILLKIKDIIFNGRGFVLKITDLHNLEIMSIGTPFLISLTTKDNKIPIAFHIEYLHQLQNLVHAMSNKELQIGL